MSAVAEAPKKVERKPAKYPRRGLESESIKLDQHEPIKHPPLGEKMENPMTIEVVDRVTEDELENLAFLEEPVKIFIHLRDDPNYSPSCTDFISNQGIPAEVLFKNGWVQMGYIPRNQAVYVKRKTLAQLAACRIDNIHVRVEEKPNEDPINHTVPITTRGFTFQVLEDKNPKGSAWLERLLTRRV